MENIKIMIRQKPRIFIYITAGYLLLAGLLRWATAPSLDALWFFVGGAIGLFFLDAAEVFFALSPSPFRSIVFGALFAVVAFFVVTSSTGTIGSGLVLSVFLQMLLWQIGEYRVHGNINSWFRMVADPVPPPTQRMILIIAAIIFIIESYLFVR
ncbi:MAG: hypothetical protein ACOY3M_01115 [Patescibacteria group bacterium]